MISFVHPAIAGIALATGLIPVLVHLLSRRRYVRVPWAAMSFLLAARRRSAGRIRLEQLLLLATRVLLILLLGLAVARPYVPATGLLPGRSSSVHRVLLLDNSLSMSAVMQTPHQFRVRRAGAEETRHPKLVRGGSGVTRFELAKRYAQALLDSFPATDSVSLITLAEPAEAVIVEGSFDRRFVRERLGSLTPTQRATDTVHALTLAAEILDASQAAPGNRAVYLISDLPRSVWQSETPARPGQPDRDPTAAIRAMRRLADVLADQVDLPTGAVGLNIIRVAGQVSENVAVTRLAAESGMLAVNLPVRIMVEVTNLGSSSRSDLVLQVRSDGQVIRRRRLATLGPRRSTVATITTQYRTPGTHLIEARLSAVSGDLPHTPGPQPELSDQAQDALAIDNTRYLSIEVRKTTPVLLVDGRPGATRLAGEAGFLAMALAPRAHAVRNPVGQVENLKPVLVDPKVISEPELAGEPLDDYDIVALCNVPRLSAQTWKQLEAFVGGGGGLLVFLGELVSADNYNRFGHRDGTGLLPVKLSRSAFSAQHRVGQVANLTYPLGFELTDRVHPIVAEFAGQPESSLFAARIDRYLPVELDSHRAELVLQYTNGDPALVVSTFRSAEYKPRSGGSSGRVLLCTTTANLDWNNLPAKGDYVSLMLSSVSYLSPRRGAHRNINVGERIHEPLTLSESSLPLRVTIVGQVEDLPVWHRFGTGVDVRSGNLTYALVPDKEGLAVEYGPVEQARAIAIAIGPEVRTFAANVDPAESDLAAIEPQELASVLGRPVHIMDVDGPQPFGEMKPAAAGSTELALVVLCLVIGLLLLEMWLAMWFGSQRA